MADGGEGVERASGEPRLPEIQLKWSDFMWSLEKVRHKPYGKTTRERDWFRVNPLEMILLGMQTFNGEPAKKDHGTMLLVMESLKDEMTLRPRYWYRLLEVLSVTIQGGKDVPPVILQRCISSLMSLWKTLRNFPEFQPSVYAKSIAQFKLIDSLEETLSCLGKLLGVTLCLELQQFLDDLKHLVSSSLELHKSIVETDGGSDMECVVHNICSGREKISLQLSVHIYLMKDMQKCFNEGSTYFCQSLSNFKKLVSTVREFGDDCCLAQLLSIFQLLAVRCDELEILQDAEQPSSPDMTEEERVEKEPTDTEKTLCYISPVSELFDSLNSSLIQWKTLSASHSHSLCGVTEKLLTFAHLILSRTTLNISLPETVSFFQEPIMLLMTYSTEGYLSDSPSEFFMELLEYMSSLVEQGTSPLKAVQTNLPNLFGPAFGVRNHMTSCKLLQYGYLAVCSQHQ